MYLARIASSSLFAILLAGCAATAFQIGTNFDLNAFTTHVNRGVTTKDQVRSWLGNPTSTGISVETSGERFDEWTYYFAEGTLSSLSSTKLKTLRVKIDKQGVVQSYDLSESAR